MRNLFLKIILPLLLIAAGESLRLYLPEYGRQLDGLELIAAAYFCVQLVVNLYIGQYLAQHRKIAVSHIVRDTIRLAIIGLFLAVFLRNVMHWNLAAILTPSAILTAIVGLAMQDTIGNFIAGMLIQIEKPFAINDWIEVEGQQGQVRELNWRYTRIETLDRYYMIIPNSKIATQKVVNYSQPTPLVNEFLSIGVSYDAPPLKVQRALETVLKSNPNIVRGNSEGVFLRAYADSAMTYEIKYAIRDFSVHRQVRSEVLAAIWYQFKKHGLEIPYPIRTVIRRPPPAPPPEHEFLDLLAALAFFKDAGKTALNNLLRCGLISHYRPQQTVIEDNAEGDSMFFVLAGEFNVCRAGQTVSGLGKGDFFGEMSLLTGERRNARVEARTTGTLLEIDRHAFRALLDDEPAMLRQIENVFNQRALANQAAGQAKAQCEEIKQTLFARFKKLFGRE